MPELLEMEAVCADLVERHKQKSSLPPYAALTDAEVAANLTDFFKVERPNSYMANIQRVGGGASMEQFFFDLIDENNNAEKLVLRLEPVSGITVTDRRREVEILNAVADDLPVPKPIWFEQVGEVFGRPGMIVNFVQGVTKDSESAAKCTGLGTSVGDRLRPVIKRQFMDYFVKLHGIDWRHKDLPSFDVPDADPQQVARWHVNYWYSMWRQDKVEDRPIVSYAFQWLYQNLPDCEDLVLIHNDYRTGNYLYDDKSGKFTAILDWEYACIGDYHEDISYSLSPVFASDHDGTAMVSDLFRREEFIDAYESQSGRKINRKTLHFYDVLTSLKTYVIVAAHGLSAVRRKQNHQDVLLTFVASTNPIFVNELHRLLFRENS